MCGARDEHHNQECGYENNINNREVKGKLINKQKLAKDQKGKRDIVMIEITRHDCIKIHVLKF